MNNFAMEVEEVFLEEVTLTLSPGKTKWVSKRQGR